MSSELKELTELVKETNSSVQAGVRSEIGPLVDRIARLEKLLEAQSGGGGAAAAAAPPPAAPPAAPPADAAGGKRWDGQVLIDVCVVPLGAGVSVRKEVTEVERILRRYEAEGKVTCKLHGYGTNVSGHWDDVMAAVKETHEVLHDRMGVVRVTSSMRLGTRIDKSQTVEDKINAVEEGLVKSSGPSG